MPCYSPLKGWKDEAGALTFRREHGKETMDVACGGCLGCRLDRSRVWAVRCVHEASLCEFEAGNSFITLTYRDRLACTELEKQNGWHVPDDYSLSKPHFQKFMKRLRKHFSHIDELTGKRVYQPIKFFHCGEYGSICRHGISVKDCESCNVGRPHYHALLFNCEFEDAVPIQVGEGITYKESETLNRLWPYGFSQIGEVTFASCAYVARYILKKVTGEKAFDHYVNIDDDGVTHRVQPEYNTMSLGRRCAPCREQGVYKGKDCLGCTGAIGRDWYEKFKTDVFPSDEVPVPGVGVLQKVPRYYETILESEDPVSLERIKEARQAFIREHQEDYTPSRLIEKYKVKKAQIKTLTRNL